VLAGEIDVSRRQSLESRNGRELAGQVARVAAVRQRIRRPVLEVCNDAGLRPPCRRLRAAKHQIQIRQKPVGFELHGAGIEGGAPVAARVVGQQAASVP
jgi:hypothetical protein